MERPHFNRAVCYRMVSILERDQVQDICSRASVQLDFAEDLSSLDRLLSSQSSERQLVICDLSVINEEEELAELVTVAHDRNSKLFGKYPHVSDERRERGLSAGIDYVVPNSAFKRKLADILGPG